jgi:hypothetical protein
VGCVSQQLTRSLARRVTDSFFCRYDECLNKIWALLNVNSLPEDSWNFESLNDTNSAYTAEIVTTSDGSYEPKIVDCSFCADPSSYAASDGTTEWPDALKDLKPIMSKCTGSDQIMDDHGNTFHVCCHSSMFAPKEEGSNAKTPSVFKGLSIMRETADSNTEFVMGMGVCCKQNTADQPVSMRRCIVASMVASNAGGGTNPMIMVCNTADSKKIYAFGSVSVEHAAAPRVYGEALPLWHMKLYKTAVRTRDGHNQFMHSGEDHEQHETIWHFICSIKIANITVYTVTLANGSVDLVLVRSKVVPITDQNTDLHTMHDVSQRMMQQASLLMQGNQPFCGDEFEFGDNCDENKEENHDEFGDGIDSFTRGCISPHPPAPTHCPDAKKLKPVASTLASPSPLFQTFGGTGGGGRRHSWFRPASLVKGD